MRVAEYKKTLRRLFEVADTGYDIKYISNYVQFSKTRGEYTLTIVYERVSKFQGLGRRANRITIQSFRAFIIDLWNGTVLSEDDNKLHFSTGASILTFLRENPPPYISVEMEADIAAFILHLKKHIHSLEQDFLVPYSDLYSMGKVIAQTHWSSPLAKPRDQSYEEFGKRISVGTTYSFIAKMVILYIAELYDDYEHWKQTLGDRLIELDSIKPWGSKYTGIEIKQALDIVTARLESGAYQDQIEALRKIKYQQP